VALPGEKDVKKRGDVVSVFKEKTGELGAL